MEMDFSKIRGLSDGQRYSFEELVCQLARRESVVTGSSFRRVEGSGGDGGVEGYWLLPGGSKYGYQAKYFTRVSFQRFQDHLIAEALLSTVTKPALAFKEGGPLSFVHAHNIINWEWQGLVEALAIQLPERYNSR